ncbi:hypothetical protein GALL_264430 [mine drainage metagenome]|uniref:GNAT family acetyltransferase n=1 Tax=mine drainage metagenome TaxID=410659 RepID=A0A1J5RHT4_9ZZZZ
MIDPSMGLSTTMGCRAPAEGSMDFLSRIVFSIASVILMMLALALVVYGVSDLIRDLGTSSHNARDAILTAIGSVVIAVAVFDVAKYFMEEEVARGKRLRTAAQLRRSLAKFISTIAIAVFIEGLVIVFQVSHTGVQEMLYPTILLATAILIVVGLGLYQRLSLDVEERESAESGHLPAP